MRRKWSANTAFLDASNHAGHEKELFFNFVKMSSGGTLLRFPYRSDAQEFKHVLVCAIHFSKHVINKNEERF